MSINNEEEFYAFISKLKNENRITEAEADAVANYVCGIFDALSMYGFHEGNF